MSGTMALVIIAGTICFFALIPAVMFVNNLRWYRAPGEGAVEGARVAVLIPARNEERNIGACVESVLGTRGVEIEVLVLDDASTDRTAEVVRGIAAWDGRVRAGGGAAVACGVEWEAACLLGVGAGDGGGVDAVSGCGCAGGAGGGWALRCGDAGEKGRAAVGISAADFGRDGWSGCCCR